jgi:hypothetical protein
MVKYNRPFGIDTRTIFTGEQARKIPLMARQRFVQNSHWRRKPPDNATMRRRVPKK